MAVRCAKCGEELLGAVNRCWKCGQQFELRPEIDGRPPVRLEMPPAGDGPPGWDGLPSPSASTAAAPPPDAPIEAVVLDEPPPHSTPPPSVPSPAPAATVAATVAAPPNVTPRPIVRRPVNTAELVEARRKSAMAMGGTVAAMVLGIFAILLAPFRFEAAFIALLGVVMGIWGLYSPRRNWALAAMLLCCLAVGLGAYTGTRQLYLWIQTQKPIEAPVQVDDNW